jgi:hypothetical protein
MSDNSHFKTFWSIINTSLRKTIIGIFQVSQVPENIPYETFTTLHLDIFIF